MSPIDENEPHNYPIHPILQKRWSPRAFAGRSVEPELLNQLFEAARWAPSSYNEQPWRFIYARKENEQKFETLVNIMTEFNVGWAANAPVLVLGITKKNFEQNGKPNRHAEHDLGQAIAHLTFEAGQHDLYVHQMAGINPEKAREVFQISENYKPLTMFAIGYHGNSDSLPEALKEKEQSPRRRKAVEDIVFEGVWEE